MAKYRHIPLKQLIIDKGYQRILDEARVEKITTEFDPALLGTLEVSLRNGKCAVFDGQHRLAALKKLKATDAPCLVHENLSVPDEAMLFVRLQTERKALRPLDRFRARLVAGEEKAHDIQQCAEEHGYKIGESGHENYIGAIAALDRVYDRGGYELLNETLDLIKTWQGEPRSTDGAIIEGMAIAIQKYSDDRRWERIDEALMDTPATALLRKAVASLESGGGSASRPQAVAKQIGRLVGIKGPYKKRSKTAAAA